MDHWRSKMSQNTKHTSRFMGSLTHSHWFSKHSLMMCWETWSISSYTVCLPGWHFLPLSRNMFSTSGECSRGCSRMEFLSRRRNACSMHSQPRFWGTSSRTREYGWILTRERLWLISQPQILVRPCRGFWGSPISTSVF